MNLSQVLNSEFFVKCKKFVELAKVVYRLGVLEHFLEQKIMHKILIKFKNIYEFYQVFLFDFLS